MHSTSALISVVHDWLTPLDEGNEICVVFFDVQKAFDYAPSAPLLLKLGINPHLLKWIQSYLTGRKQFVVVEAASSPSSLGSPPRICPWPSCS